MPREKKFDSPAARQAAYRARLKEAQVPDSVMTDELGLRTLADNLAPTKVPEEPQPGPTFYDHLTVPDLCIKARAGDIVLVEADEQRIRDFWGYTSSEKRTLLERDAVAARINAP